MSLRGAFLYTSPISNAQFSTLHYFVLSVILFCGNFAQNPFYSMITATPPHEFSHVNNPVFVQVSSTDVSAVIMVDIYYRSELYYTASVLAASGTQRINIAGVLSSMVKTPMPWPLPDGLISSIVNWLSAYRIVVREISGGVNVSSWSSAELYAVPGGIDSEYFLQMTSLGTNVFQQRITPI